jgi:hypothetical protein
MWDVFICHAWEDKEEIARPLAEALQQAGLQVWYDEFTLELGDSLRRSINQGLKASRYGVVILSPAFFEKEWPQKELDGLAAKERHGEKVILPVWHNATYDDVEQYSPELADRLAVSTERGLTGVVRQILRVCRKHKARQGSPKAPGKQEVPHAHQRPQSPPSTQVETQGPRRRQKEKRPRRAGKPQEGKTPQETRRAPVIQLRGEPLIVSKEEFREVFGLDEKRHPLEYIQNDYEDQGEVVIDHATGLIWQKSGSDSPMSYASAQEYVKRLNRQRFAGHDDWRLPTIPELMSLLEPIEKNGAFYIDPVFDSKQSWCWSADREIKGEAGPAWYVSFGSGYVYWYYAGYSYYVRCVCSRK